ncbi:hypothetical protein STAFG_1980 [Streptomyces afghaniensis 772]|uniref:Uncharacterized protein n=1 Tax=Streptomyces afghaniensis 772 TaxID=1283301 RepID=S4NR65_9ACTN|nr:hypothetical protein STAFG_1980 [Streptomyces afghaniensis 772]
MILEEAPEKQTAASRETAATSPDPGLLSAAVPWLLSAADETALRAQARRLAAEAADRPGLSPTDIAHSLAVSRSALPTARSCRPVTGPGCWTR